MSRLHRRTLFWALVLGMVLALLTYTSAFQAVLTQARSASAHAPAHGTLVVLGHQMSAEGLSGDFQARLARARQALIQSPDRPVIFSGGPSHAFSAVSEARAGAQWLAQWAGTPSPTWQLEELSTNTLENLRHSFLVQGQSTPLVVISSRYHLARVQAIARELGIPVRLVAAEDHWAWSWGNLGAVAREASYLMAFRMGLGPAAI